MDNRSLEANASANPPAAPGAPSLGYPKAGNPQTNDPASKPGPYWFYAIGEELRAIILAGGLVPNAGNLTQVRDAIQVMINASLPADALVFKGVIDCSANPNYPAGNAGDVYKVSVAGKIGGAAGPDVEVGDTLFCITDGSAAGDHATVGANWNVIQVNILGGFGLLRTVVFTANGTWNKGANTKKVRVYVIGGGGGGGGYSGGNYGAGGGGGGAAIKLIDVTAINSETVTIGSGGAGGAGGGAGGNGGSSSFGAHCSATGGAGGGAGGPTAGAGGGVGSGGDLNPRGNPGEGSYGTNPVHGGGGSIFAGGGTPGGAGTATYGGGGGSAYPDGFAGANGLVLVEEYA